VFLLILSPDLGILLLHLGFGDESFLDFCDCKSSVMVHQIDS
jgi:hypothetical protein